MHLSRALMAATVGGIAVATLFSPVGPLAALMLIAKSTVAVKAFAVVGAGTAFAAGGHLLLEFKKGKPLCPEISFRGKNHPDDKLSSMTLSEFNFEELVLIDVGTYKKRSLAWATNCNYMPFAMKHWASKIELNETHFTDNHRAERNHEAKEVNDVVGRCAKWFCGGVEPVNFQDSANFGVCKGGKHVNTIEKDEEDEEQAGEEKKSWRSKLGFGKKKGTKKKEEDDDDDDY